jgi:M6 family metalloprotease-like protein
MFVTFFCVSALFSVTAYPYLIEFIQPDGTTLEIYLKGDEKIKWAETADGYSLVYNQNGFLEYAKLNESGELIPSGLKAENILFRNQIDVDFLSGISKHLFYSESQIITMKQIWQIREKEKSRAFPTTGNRKLVCLLIGFQDLAFTKTQSEFHYLFNQVGYSAEGATGSVKDYYLENSYNQFQLTVDVFGPYTASNNMSYYGANDTYGYDLRPDELVSEAINLADNEVNYAEYDNDNDGWVDGLYVIYAGYGEEAGGGVNCIWAHAWYLSSPLLKDGVYLQNYSCSSELRGNFASGISRIGVICHEFGHTLGAPDYYDTDYGTGGQFDGTGQWDLMADGAWNNSGITPAHHNGLTKVHFYGWAVVNYISSGATLTLFNAAQYYDSFYRYETNTINEYFFIENRHQVGFDSNIPGEGMLIYHVHSNFASAAASNTVNDTHPQMMYPVCAGASTNPSSNSNDYGAINWNGTPFPGVNNKTQFTDLTTPHAKSWAGVNTTKPITNISRNSMNQTVTFDFMGGDVSGISISIDNPLDRAVIALGTTVSFDVTATDTAKIGITQVDFYIDNLSVPVQTSYSSPYSYSWDTTGYTEGMHTLKAVAYDDASPYNYKSAIIHVSLISTISLPFTENFETSVPPSGWKQVVLFAPGNPPPAWTHEFSGINPVCTPYNGNFMAQYNSFSCPPNSMARLELPALDLSTAINAAVSFYMYHDLVTPNLDGISIDASFDGVMWYNIGGIIHRFDNTVGWKLHTVDASAFDGQSPVFFGITGISQTGGNMYIDDLKVDSALPSFAINYTALSFGNVEVMHHNMLQFSITNAGGGVLTGDITMPFPEYQISLSGGKNDSLHSRNKKTTVRESLAYSISSGQTQTYNILFSPVHVGHFHGNMIITSNDSTNPSTDVLLDGYGISAMMMIYSFSNSQTIPENETATNNFIIFNEGLADLVISSTEILYGKEKNSWLSISTLPGNDLQHGEYYYFLLSFDSNGLTEATYTAQLIVVSNDLQSPHYFNITLDVDNSSSTSASAGGNNGGTGVAYVDVPPIVINSITIDPNISITPTGAVPIAVDVTVSNTPLNPVANPENVLLSYQLDITGNVSGNNLSGVLYYGSLSPSFLVWYNGTSWQIPNNVSWSSGHVSFNFTINSKGTEIEFLIGGENPLPVTLSSFTANYEFGNAFLKWTTQSELNNSHWNVYRSISDNFGQSQKLNANGIEGGGTVNEPTNYLFHDEAELIPEMSYWYWIECVDYSGNEGLFAPVFITIPEEQITTPEIPLSYGLYANYPNPFNPSTQISFALKEGANVDLAVYDIKGRMIRTILSGETVSAEKVIRTTWDGKDETGKEVGSGVYFYRLKAGTKDYIRKMLLIK